MSTPPGVLQPVGADGGRAGRLAPIRDLVKAAIADQQFRIAQLESYISGWFNSAAAIQQRRG